MTIVGKQADPQSDGKRLPAYRVPDGSDRGRDAPRTAERLLGTPNPFTSEVGCDKITPRRIAPYSIPFFQLATAS